MSKKKNTSQCFCTRFCKWERGVSSSVYWLSSEISCSDVRISSSDPNDVLAIHGSKPSRALTVSCLGRDAIPLCPVYTYGSGRCISWDCGKRLYLQSSSLRDNAQKIAVSNLLYLTGVRLSCIAERFALPPRKCLEKQMR